MKQYNVICPKCGKINRGLYLWETQGSMECNGCGTHSQLAVLCGDDSELALSPAALNGEAAGRAIAGGEDISLIRGPWCRLSAL